MDDIRGRRFIHDGPSSGAVVYDMVRLKVLMRFPNVKTAMEEPCTRIEAMTRNDTIGHTNDSKV
jgi:hypothetical protein